jgi:hypothetical protein
MGWTHWKHFRLHRLSDALVGRPSILTDEQLDQVIEFAMKHVLMMENLWRTCSSRTVAASCIHLRCQIWRNLLTHCTQSRSWIKWLNPVISWAYLSRLGVSRRKIRVFGNENPHINIKVLIDSSIWEIKWSSLLQIRKNATMREIWLTELCGYLFVESKWKQAKIKRI